MITVGSGWVNKNATISLKEQINVFGEKTNRRVD